MITVTTSKTVRSLTDRARGLSRDIGEAYRKADNEQVRGRLWEALEAMDRVFDRLCDAQKASLEKEGVQS